MSYKNPRVTCQEQQLKSMQSNHAEAQQQLEWWRVQVDDLKAQLRGEATRVLELQKKAYNAKMAQEAATQVTCVVGTSEAMHTVVQIQAGSSSESSEYKDECMCNRLSKGFCEQVTD